MIAFKHFDNDFKYIEISNTSAHAKIALQGAHLFHYARIGEEPLLWLSKKTFFKIGKAIRGGVPVCWPWFGKYPTNDKLPQHGFARNSMWELKESREIDEGTSEVILQLQPSAVSLQLWPYKFELFLSFTIGRTITMALTTRNSDTQTFQITSALHSYFAVENIGNVYVEGLANNTYYDKVIEQEQTQQGNVTISKEVDRIYHKVDYPLTLHDKARRINVNATGSFSSIIWNPWKEKCISMDDMEDDGYKTMLCIEAANAPGDAIKLAPGEEHTLTVVISSNQE